MGNKYHSASSTQRSQRDKYDMTSEEEAIVMNNMQHQPNEMSDHLMNYADCKNNTSSSRNTALTYSSSNPELGQSCFTIFLKSLKMRLFHRGKLELVIILLRAAKV